ncbi:maltose ABC transporter permease MalF, partial [Vibrio parahaemolyticus]|nr:maltose ABC transporter permease MalF [Vibrio parahaemolyticus]
LFPLAYTIGLAFTNYSAKNQLSFDRAQNVLLDRTYQSGDSYPFTLYKTEQGHQLVVEKDGELLASPTFQLDNLSASEFDLSPIEEVTGEKESIKAIVKNRSALSSVDLHLPSG